MTFSLHSLLAGLVLAICASSASAQTGTGTTAPAPAASKPTNKAAPKAPANNAAKAPAAAAVSKPPPAVADTTPISVGPAPSAPYKGKPTPKPLTAGQGIDTRMAPGELKPERPVAPQVKVPLGRTPPDSTHQGTGGSINDAASRCLAIADENERAMCRERAGQGGGSK